MKLLLLNQTRILICLDYYHNIKYFLIDNSSITEVSGPVANYSDILSKWNHVRSYSDDDDHWNSNYDSFEDNYYDQGSNYGFKCGLHDDHDYGMYD